MASAKNKDQLYTKAELTELWRRPLPKQYTTAQAKMLEAIVHANGDIDLSFSGGKDSALMLDMYCELISSLPEYKDIPIRVSFANTTNETDAMKKYIKEFIPRCENLYGVKIDFKEILPPITWAEWSKTHGIPLITKKQAKNIRIIKRDLENIDCTLDDLKRLYMGGEKAKDELFDMGFSKTSVLALTGYVSYKGTFGKMFILSKKWLPMTFCPVPISEECCVNIKEKPLQQINSSGSIMTGEQASESTSREHNYMRTGCNMKLANGIVKSKPFGPMTQDGILYACKTRNLPICSDYGDIVVDEDGHYRCTKANRTGCALCGFGCQFDKDRFVRLAETEPAKVKFAFTSRKEGGLGYKEALEYMNEYCGTKIKIPEV